MISNVSLSPKLKVNSQFICMTVTKYDTLCHILVVGQQFNTRTDVVQRYCLPHNALLFVKTDLISVMMSSLFLTLLGRGFHEKKSRIVCD